MTIQYLIRAISAEALKIKRSLALLFALLIPLAAVFVNFMITVQNGLGKPALGITSPWSIYFMYSIKLWVIFCTPLSVSVLGALSADVDHRAKAWKHLFVLPFPRSAIMAGKWLSLTGINLLSTLVFGLANLACGFLILWLRPEQGLELPIPFLEALTKPLIAWLLSYFMISIHLWISLRWPNFLVSVTIGFAASITNLFLLSSSLYQYSVLSPWAMPAQAYDNWQTMLVPSLIGSFVTYWLAWREFACREAG
jgi:hypothetical protein